MVETEVPILDLLSKQLHAELQSFRDQDAPGSESSLPDSYKL